ncbi:restriction endonuclease [Shinella sp. AETb1-6]|uniref:restriction endonuclease n=1 Tax=Shinella sp. AETb1-6 TaxID=2692210 RepID=UPI001369BD24|nr:restriction endonuclease [Shinella sp. AETb1-6]MXN50098.1 restriction endonuclease [Shinella sp. AETb1-6]
MKREAENWEHYERMIARLMADQIDTSLCVTPNARVIGKISGRSRQIDVLIDARHDTDDSRRIIVDAKRRKRKIDVTDVEAFRGMMDDVGATHGYLVCPTGYTAAAEKRAQMAVTICLVPLDHIKNFNPSTWPACQNPACERGRIFWDGYPELSMVLQPITAETNSSPIVKRFVHHVGKCDRCGRFHVQCNTCGDILSTPEDDENDIGHQCSCRMPWFWLASVEEGDDGAKSAELHWCQLRGVVTVDRRPYRR